MDYFDIIELLLYALVIVSAVGSTAGCAAFLVRED